MQFRIKTVTIQKKICNSFNQPIHQITIPLASRLLLLSVSAILSLETPFPYFLHPFLHFILIFLTSHTLFLHFILIFLTPHPAFLHFILAFLTLHWAFLYFILTIRQSRSPFLQLRIAFLHLHPAFLNFKWHIFTCAGLFSNSLSHFLNSNGHFLNSFLQPGSRSLLFPVSSRDKFGTNSFPCLTLCNHHCTLHIIKTSPCVPLLN